MWSQKAKILMVALSPAGGEMRPHCFGLLFNESLRLLISDKGKTLATKKMYGIASNTWNASLTN